MDEVMPPEREETPTLPGLNQARAEAARPPIMPSTPLPRREQPERVGPDESRAAALAASSAISSTS